MLLLGLTALMAASGLMIARASSFPVLYAGQGAHRIVIGGFWSLSAATAIRLVPQRRVPRALAILTVVTHWPRSSRPRWAATWGHRRLARRLLCLVPLAMVAFIWQCVSLPSMKSQRVPERQGKPCCVCSVARRYPFGLLACGLFFMGQFTLFTYVRPFLEIVTRGQPSGLSPDITGDWRRRFCRHAAYYDRSERPVLSDTGGYPFVNGRDCRNASAGRAPHRFSRRTVKPVGPAGDGSAHRLVDMDCADAARGMRRAGGGLMVAVIQLSIAPGQRQEARCLIVWDGAALCSERSVTFGRGRGASCFLSNTGDISAPR